jgi:hypothetical protein
MSCASSGGFIANWGARCFAYPAPAGIKSLKTASLPASVVTKPSTVMDVSLWTGNGIANARTISGLNFSPDLVWIKNRTVGYGHQLYDVVRGTTRALQSNTTGAEIVNDVAGTLSSFNSDGFTTSPITNNSSFNDPSHAYVAWTWDAGTTTTTNTQGSISSQVRASTSSGFSVVTWTATNGAATIGHGLGVAPEFIIVKDRDTSTFWQVYHVSIGNTAAISLNSTNASSASAQQWNNTSPTSTVFSVGSNSNYLTDKHVAYCFAPVAGYSSFGSYTGNGSSQFVYLGFRPKFWMHKRTDSSGSWMMVDAVRSSYNVAQDQLYANLSNADSQYGGSGILDFVSNGVVLRSTGADVNGSSVPYIYSAFAESPFGLNNRAR